MRRVLLLILAPIAILVALELAFRAGAYEPLARPTSHAGTSVRVKRALADPRLAHVDTVTLGSSRGLFGLDHAALAEAARRHGLVHANLSMPGVQWMSVGVVADWLARNHPEVQGGVIALSELDFVDMGGGTYQLAIVTPFRSWSDRANIESHVGVVRGDPSTYGVLSALMAYREDVRDLLLNPLKRREELAEWRARDPVAVLQTNIEDDRDLCATPVDTVQQCAKLVAHPGAAASPVVALCRKAIGATLEPREDYAAAMRGVLPPRMAEVRDSIRGQLRGLRWTRPAVVVLMPVHALWRNQIEPVGLHEWTLEILRPLVEEGRVVVLDHGDDFIHDGATDCSLFIDQYHPNDRGRARLAPRIEREIEAALFARR